MANDLAHCTSLTAPSFDLYSVPLVCYLCSAEFDCRSPSIAKGRSWRAALVCCRLPTACRQAAGVRPEALDPSGLQHAAYGQSAQRAAHLQSVRVWLSPSGTLRAVGGDGSPALMHASLQPADRRTVSSKRALHQREPQRLKAAPVPLWPGARSGLLQLLLAAPAASSDQLPDAFASAVGAGRRHRLRNRVKGARVRLFRPQANAHVTRERSLA